MPKKQLIGTVVSNKMQKTVVVMTMKMKIHSKYKKRFNIRKKYKAHDEENKCKIGDKVLIEETRPISKEKKWRVIKIISSAKNEASLIAEAPTITEETVAKESELEVESAESGEVEKKTKFSSTKIK